MSILPKWAKKPKHKDNVIATSRGWVVEKTGEVLSSHRGLDEKLKELHKEIEQVVDEKPIIIDDNPEPQKEPVEPVVVDEGDSTSEDKSVETESTEQKEPKQAKSTTKRRGRPPKKSKK